ncbi:MAG: CDP-alcohol phosphatidyltransferase family protein [Treponema sp.]|nr:CDP-alcohol phosphatidyltransferase family protein [Treponema sp.]
MMYINKEGEKNNIINIPNLLSLLRFILSFSLLFIWDIKYLLFSIILLCGLTDIIDGFIAKKLNQKTVIGAWLDSIADFTFYIILTLCALFYESDILMELKYYVIIITSIKIISIIICLIKYRKFGFLHTLGNKITGIILFINICVFILFNKNIIFIGLCISIIFSIEELIINIIGKKYNENVKGIFEIIIKK